jgi:CTP:molybdopterin cytidylyltransferase MocA
MIVGILLAAGGATRFGSQKLIAPYRGEPLVHHAARLLRSVTDEAIAVIGNDAAAVRGALAGADVRVIENADWREGLSTSLRAGIRAVPPSAEAVIVALGDQPEMDPAVARALVAEWRASALPMVTARYRGVRSPPVLIAREIFNEVEALHGDSGAKPLMDRLPGRVAFIDVDTPVPFDVDTPTDLDRGSA